MTTQFKTLNTGDIASTAYKELTWTPPKDITLRKMLLIERSDYSLSNVQCYIKLAGEPFTLDYVPGSVIGQDLEYCWKPEKKINKGSEIYIKILNSRAETINVDVVFEYE
jgi:hypothetical protein